MIADTLGYDLNECAIYGREGDTGARDRKTIGFLPFVREILWANIL